MNRIIFATSLILAIVLSSFAKAEGANCFDEIVKAIAEGNHTKLSTRFSSNVECDILGNSAPYSKAQAALVLKNFFLQNKPKQFDVIHQGGKNPRFIIGSYKSTSGSNFRISCFVRYDDARKEFLIFQIRIENELAE